MAQAPEITATGSGAYRPGSLRGAEGYFRVAQSMTGQWSLLDPAGRPFFVKAVHDVRGDRQDETPVVGSVEAAVRLRRWEFNAVGVGGDGAGRDDGLAFFASVEFTATVTPILAPHIRLPDVFDPDWPQRAAAHASVICGSHIGNRELIGWVSDRDLAWGSSAANRPGLLQVCLSLEPTFAAYHAAWEFTLASHGGSLESVARAWNIELANKEVVRELTRAETGLVTRGYLRDDLHWSREFARRYFTTTSAAIRAVDANHLLCGCRFRGPIGAAILGMAVYPSVDLAMPHWTELPPAAGSTNPLLAGDVGWSDPAFWSAPPATAAGVRRGSRLTAVERMLRRARTSLKRLARHPAVVGYVWRQWHDDPGEQPPFASGLVHPNGIEAREHTELLADFNLRADALRRATAKLLSP